MQRERVMLIAALSCLLSILPCVSSVRAADYSTPDYRPNANVTPYTTSGPITIKYSVSNLSDVPAPSTTIEFSVAPTGAPSKRTVLGTAPVPALNRWSSAGQTVSYPLPAALPLGYTAMQLTARVTTAGGEAKTGNNTVTNSFAVQVASVTTLPDLTVSSVTAPDSAVAGSTISISEAIRNLGTSSAGEFSVACALVSPQGRATLPSHTVSGLAAGGESLSSLKVTVPSTLAAGTYTLTVQANATGSVREVTTTNNTFSRPFTITGGPTPTPAPQPTPPPAPAPNTGGTYIGDQASYPVPALSRPPLHAPVIDPTFKTTVMRMTDPTMAPSNSSSTTLGIRHEYSRFPALNADNSKVVVRVIGGVDRGFFEVRDLASGSLLFKIAPVRGDPEMSWHPTDPNRLLYRAGNEVRIFHVDTGQNETVLALPQYYAISTRGEGRPSDDWRYFAFLAFTDSSFSRADVVVADLVNKRIVTTQSQSGRPDWVSMSPSGNYVVMQWTNGQGTRLYDRNSLAYIRTLFGDPSHSDFAYDATGQEVLVYHATGAATIAELGSPSGSPLASARLSDGKRTILLNIGWGWFTPHFSGIASRAHPGWVLVSTYTSPENAQHPYAREIFWLNLDGSGGVRRIAHHHSDQARPSSGKDYWAEPQATSSWDGSIVLFSSVWGQPFSEYDLYTVTGSWW